MGTTDAHKIGPIQVLLASAFIIDNNDDKSYTNPAFGETVTILVLTLPIEDDTILFSSVTVLNADESMLFKAGFRAVFK